MMTIFDALHYQRVLERWRVLAERRLEHLTLLYETGRWRRYFSEEQFIGVIRETRAAVQTWQRIAPEQVSGSQLPIPSEEPIATRTQPPPSPFAADEHRHSVA